MKHFLTIIRQYTAVAFLVAINLGAYGCGDTASINPVAELATLTVTPGTLQPTFNRTITQYSVDLTSDITTVTVTAQPAVAGDRVTINGQTTTSHVIALGEVGTTTPVSIVVSESGNNSKTYTVLLRRADLGGNNSLQSLTVSPGTLTPAFDANLLSYTVDVDNTVTSVIVSATKSDPNAVMLIESEPIEAGTATGQVTVPLGEPGSNTLVSIIVTAQNGNEKPYTVIVSRGISSNANLQGLTISPGTLDPPFSASTVGYTVDVASNVGSVVVTPMLQDAHASMTVNGQPTNSGQDRTITLNGPGSNTFINIIVTAENNTSQKNYVVVVTRAPLGDNNLSALTVTPGSLVPAFDSATLAYTVNVASDVTSVDVSATKADPNAVLSGSVPDPGAGQETGQATIPLNGPGTSTPVSITVTAPNGGAPKTYLITVNQAALSSDNNLSALTVTPGSLVPAFDSATLAYTVNVASDVTSVDVSATKSDPNAVMAISSVTVPAGTASGSALDIPLEGPGSDTPVSIIVTAQNGVDSKTYTVTVHRAAPASDNNLLELTVTGGPLVPDFAPSTTTYTVDVPLSVDNVTVSATKSDPDAVMSGDVTAGAGVATGQATFLLIPLIPTSVSITITAPNGDSKIYSIVITRALL